MLQLLDNANKDEDDEVHEGGGRDNRTYKLVI